MAEKSNYPGQLVFGLDIGTRSVVGTIGYKKEEDFYIVAQCIKEHETRAMMDGQIHDINKVAAIIKSVKETLEEKTDRKYKDVCIAAAGRVLQTLTIETEVKFKNDHAVTSEDIYGLESLGMEQAYEQFTKMNDTDIKFYCVGYSVVRYYLNGFQINKLEGHRAKKIAADIIATFLPDDVVAGLYAAVEQAGLRVANLTLEPIAAMQVAIPENYRTLNIALVDIGAGTSDISITKDGSIIAYGMIPCAGDALTDAISKHCLIDFQMAEKVKRQAENEDTIAYRDIMDLPFSITREEIEKVVEPIMNSLAKEVADKIRVLNADKSVSAVFVVGGGGKFAGFTKKLAKELEILPERVALRGVNMAGNIYALNGEDFSDAIFVTPIGICLNFYEQNNNFIYVKFNGKRIKLYDSGKLTVVDASLQADFPNDCVFPKRGTALNFVINGKPKIVRGALGEAAIIKVNDENADLHTPVMGNDKIEIKKSTAGEPASMQISQLEEFKSSIEALINGQKILLPKFASVNGELKSGYYEIENKDNIVMVPYYTVSQVIEFMDVVIEREAEIYVNNKKANLQTKVYDKFAVEWVFTKEDTNTKEENTRQQDNEQKTFAKTQIENKITGKSEANATEKSKVSSILKQDIHIKVNGNPLTMKGKTTYVFVDIFDYIDFDLTKPRGKGIVTTVNGQQAQYMQMLSEQDDVIIYWKE